MLELFNLKKKKLLNKIEKLDDIEEIKKEILNNKDIITKNNIEYEIITILNKKFKGQKDIYNILK